MPDPGAGVTRFRLIVAALAFTLLKDIFLFSFLVNFSLR
jgi:hypothetical protein